MAGFDLEQVVLTKLMNSMTIEDTYDYATELNIDHQILIGTLKSLLTDQYVTDEPLSTSYWTITDEAKKICANGSFIFHTIFLYYP